MVAVDKIRRGRSWAWVFICMCTCTLFLQHCQAQTQYTRDPILYDKYKPPCVPLANAKVSNTSGCMPLANFGTGSSTKHLNHSEIERLTELWLSTGGSGIDTAWTYKDEKQVGNALHKIVRDRNSVFVTTKVPCDGFAAASRQAATNRRHLGLDYVDLVLIHFPCRSKLLLAMTWKALEDEFHNGKAKALGVSNFKLGDLKDLNTVKDLKVKPVVNQIYMHVGCMANANSELVDYCRANGILLEAYSPLGKGVVLKDGDLLKIASNRSLTPAQVALQYLIQKDAVFTFTSTSAKHMRESAQVGTGKGYMLSSDEMKTLDNISVACRDKDNFITTTA
mmetsp:Transcript_3195/g.3885  ORF Transcript_3195/g.3885 Transcript_3195/m.3885 type:complete len:336 (+) Transcript_3195:108-1115(+)|eukprot:CAMPEP_0204835666 /NCGR_PEP_ID=MMETSP1346-20131115/23247_1 /ASSEMBLY_ACC=CAM_ASM_000771 /TAXON_ID=215587 /ORGANISM="Aplanochytrium stocchinoi, Strain GSBS06" /LENGTH=335 /DNA_ID=CAMNT_0051969873 /DNA_START=12 /DNA_END=1019 /DNA_ORIENTATION=+